MPAEQHPVDAAGTDATGTDDVTGTDGVTGEDDVTGVVVGGQDRRGARRPDGPAPDAGAWSVTAGDEDSAWASEEEAGSAWEPTDGGGSVWDADVPVATTWGEISGGWDETLPGVADAQDGTVEAPSGRDEEAPAVAGSARRAEATRTPAGRAEAALDAADPVDAMRAALAARGLGDGAPAAPHSTRPSTSRPRGARGAPRGRRAPAAEPPDVGAAAVDAEPDHESVARSIVLRQLTAAPRSRQQLADALARREVPEDVAERVLDRFTEVGLVDDAAYAEMLVRSRHAERGLSRRALALELRRRGVDDGLAREALEQVGDDDEEGAARALARKKLASTRGLERETRLRRAYAALGRRGYGGSLVSRVVREELAAEGAQDEGASGDDDGGLG